MDGESICLGVATIASQKANLHGSDIMLLALVQRLRWHWSPNDSYGNDSYGSSFLFSVPLGFNKRYLL